MRSSLCIFTKWVRKSMIHSTGRCWLLLFSLENVSIASAGRNVARVTTRHHLRSLMSSNQRSFVMLTVLSMLPRSAMNSSQYTWKRISTNSRLSSASKLILRSTCATGYLRTSTLALSWQWSRESQTLNFCLLYGKFYPLVVFNISMMFLLKRLFLIRLFQIYIVLPFCL